MATPNRTPVSAVLKRQRPAKSVASTTQRAAPPGGHGSAGAPAQVPTESPIDRLPAHVPLMYADQIVDVVYGVHTSKLVFGVETGSGQLRSVGAVAIPTAALLNAASNIVQFLTSPAVVDETTQRMTSVLSMMRSTSGAPARSEK